MTTMNHHGKRPMPTDKKRLDFMREAWGLDLLPNGWAVRLNRAGTEHGPEDTTQRRAIDAAILAKRSKGVK